MKILPPTSRQEVEATKAIKLYVPLECAYITAQLHGITAHNILNLMSLF
jgi:hypothetical protein